MTTNPPSEPSPDPTETPQQPTRAGYVALMGPPNVGKSTLMNALVGERLSIVTSKAQTTWQKVAGILTTENRQAIFLDTPGLLDPVDLLQESLLAQAREAIRDADVLILVLDPVRPPGTEMKATLREISERSSVPLVVAINKADLARPDQMASLQRWVSDELGLEAHAISALSGKGLPELLEVAGDHLPESPFLYPADEIATDPVRFFVAEMVRETVFEQFQQEVPYAVFTQVEDFRQAGEGNRDRTYIQVTIFVERASQKGILIGDKGTAIRALGTAARRKIEHFLDEPVYLELWVKVLPGWRKKRAHLKRLGFSVPGDNAHQK